MIFKKVLFSDSIQKNNVETNHIEFIRHRNQKMRN